MKNILKLFPYIKGFYSRIAGLAGFSIVIAIINAYRPQIYKQIVDTVSSRGSNLSWNDVMPYLWVLLAVSVIWIIINYAFNIIAMRAHLTARSTLRLKVFEKLTSLSVDYFDTHRPGAIMQKTGDAVNSFAAWVMGLNYSLLGPIFSIIVITIILFLNSPWLGILSLMIVIFSSFEYRRTISRNKQPNKAWRKHNERSWAVFSETIQNMTTISTLSSFGRFQTKMAREEAGAVKMGTGVRSRWQLSGARITGVNELAYLLGIVVVLAQVIQGNMSVGEFVAITAYFSTIRSDALAFASFIPDTDRVERDVERLIGVLETEPTFPDAEHAKTLKHLESLEFRNVSFTYPDGKKGAIYDVSFRVDKKHSIALVGPSGVGKSTITKLMLRFYPPSEGEIYINDLPADTYTQESIRRHIGMVMQDVALFNTTVKENLRLAKANATMADLEYAAEQAHADSFIDDLPKQYNTVVGERGVKLSGGQKQRIAIARAILKDPDLIVLDEATSALDSESERLVQAGLKRLMKGRLSLTIAHRLSTVRHADEIIVLKKGSIAERGTHEELIQKPRGLYHKLFKLQSATGEVKL
ncbi:ABC transporter ATP-binding protein [Candidatus Saccharibacteria bacterium]|nr:ABC transporter ATP-binding protein [Candidatus Saccharibacteria bacterium]